MVASAIALVICCLPIFVCCPPKNIFTHIVMYACTCVYAIFDNDPVRMH